MKKILSIVLAVCMMFSLCAVPAMAEEAMPISQIQTKDIITITVNGNYVDCSTYGQLPVIVEGRTLVPLRAVFEALGATVAWDDATKTVTSVKGDITVALTVGTNQIVVNGTAKTIDVPAQIMNDRTMVPVRAVAEAFGCDVQWDNNTRTVVITSNVVEAPVTEETPEAVVKKAYDAIFALDFEKGMSYYKNPAAAMGGLTGVTDISSIVNMFAGEALTEEQVKLVEKFTLDMMSLITYEITGMTVDGDTAEVYVTTYVPDFENMAIEEYLTEEAIALLYSELLAEMGYTMEDLATITDEAEIEKVTNALVAGMFDYIVVVLSLEAETAGYIATEDVETLEKVDGKWLIVE